MTERNKDMNNEEKILSILEALVDKVDKLEARQVETHQLATQTHEMVIKTHEIATAAYARADAAYARADEAHALAVETNKMAVETHNNLIKLENTIAPKINALYETRSDLVVRVEKLEETVKKIELGSEMIRLVDRIRNETVFDF